MKISRETLHQLIENKLCQAGLKREHAATVAEVLVYADARGSTLMARCALNTTPNAFQKAAPTANRSFVLRKLTVLGNFTCRQCRRTGRGENGYGTCHQNRPAKGVAVVGINRMGHSGAISYFVQQAAAPD